MNDRNRSFFGSQGDQKTTTLYVAMISRISALKTKSAAEKARTLTETISIIQGWCGINHLGVRKASEEFRNRFVERNDTENPPKLTGTYNMESRLIPLYVPWNSTQNHLSYFHKKKDGEENGQYTYSLLFIDTDGNVVRFEVYSKEDGNMIDFPHEVKVAIIGEAEITAVMENHPLLFDYCMRQLIEICEDAIQRAFERAEAVRKSLHAITVVTGEMRKDDLTVCILLERDEQHGMPGSNTHINSFRRIVNMAGRTPSERLARLKEQCELLHLEVITQLSELDATTTTKLIDNPEWTAPQE